MGILQLPTVLPSQVGLAPATKKMVTTDNLATITTAGYLNQYDLQSNPISPTDILQVIYSYSQATNSGTYSEFTVSIANGVITLTQLVNPGNVLLPVTSGDFAVFNGTTGQIKDSGSKPSASSQPYVVMSPGTLTSGHFPQFSDVNGTLSNGLPSSGASGQNFVVTTAGSVTSGHILKSADANGTVADGGMSIKLVKNVEAGGGGGQGFTIPETACTTTSLVIPILVLSVNGQTTNTSILSVVPGNGSFVITFEADPGVNSMISYLVIN